MLFYINNIKNRLIRVISNIKNINNIKIKRPHINFKKMYIAVYQPLTAKNMNNINNIKI